MFGLTKPLDILDLHIRYDYYEIHIMSLETSMYEKTKKKKKKLTIYSVRRSFSMAPIIQNTDKFTSFKSFNTNFVSIATKLKRNSLREIGVLDYLDSFKDIYPVLLYYKNSLTSIFENEDYIQTNFID